VDKRIEWSKAKNKTLKATRSVTFEIVAQIIYSDEYLGVSDHPNKIKYPQQRIYIVFINNYYYYVPFVEDDDKIFLKTIIPSRKIKRKYTKQK